MKPTKTKAVSLALAFAFFSNSAEASIEIKGNIILDTTTNSSWLSFNSTRGYSYNDIMQGRGNSFRADGWRYATGQELSDFFSNALPSLTTKAAVDASGKSFYGGESSDFFAPYQLDVNKEGAALVSAFGGATWGTSLYGIFSREAYCSGGCTGRAMAGITFWDDKVQVQLGGGAQDTFASTLIGHFLISGQPSLPVVTSPVPEPSSYAMMVLGLGVVGLLARRKRKTTAVAI